MASEETTNSEMEFAIVGGGICGVVLAIGMLKRGLKVQIYEQAHAFGEIGAGIAFGPNSVKALNVCHPSALEALNKVATHNQSPEKSKVWFDWVDGTHDVSGEVKWCFRLENELGANSVHRAHMLAELVKLLPEGVSHFRKRLENISETADGLMMMTFTDGSSATADAIIGCDGIKSRTRHIILGDDHPSALPVYTHKYAFRGLIPMEKAVAALGDDLAQNSFMHMGKDGHLLTFAVDHGETMNVVAFKTNVDEDWPDHEHFVLPSNRNEVSSAFKDFGNSVHAILDLLDDNLDRWAIFDLGEHPLPTYFKGRICLLGDSAHATSPHHGAGAGIGVEDAAVMAELLASINGGEGDTTKEGKVKKIEAAFAVFDESRRERTQWLVQSSRRVGDLYEWRASGVGDDIDKIQEELRWRCDRIWSADVEEMIEAAKENLNKRLAV